MASSLNKLSQEEPFIEAFSIQIKKFITSKNPDLPQKISRCFENCQPALEGVKKNIQDLYEIFTNSQNLAGVSRVILSLETLEKSPNLNLVENVTFLFENEDVPGTLLCSAQSKLWFGSILG